MAFSRDQLQRLNILPVRGKGAKATIDVENVLCAQPSSRILAECAKRLELHNTTSDIVPVTLLAVTRLIPTTNVVYPARLKRMARENTMRPALVWHHKRKYYVLMGHHDVVTHMLLGQHKVPVRIIYDA